MLTGLSLPDQGCLMVNGKVVFDSDLAVNVPVHLRRFWLSFPRITPLFPAMTVEENISYGLRVRKKDFERSTLVEMASTLGIADKLHCHPSELSGGATATRSSCKDHAEPPQSVAP